MGEVRKNEKKKSEEEIALSKKFFFVLGEMSSWDTCEVVLVTEDTSLGGSFPPH